MSIDLNFWKYRSGVYLDNAMVYQKTCCDNEQVEGLEQLPIDAILKETAAAFHEWTSLDPFNYEREGRGSFQISATPQTVRFDCYSMERADMKRFSSILSKFGCPLYDPQQGVRFDKLCAFLIDEAGEYKTQVEQSFSRLLPHLEFSAQIVTWNEYVQLSKTLKHIQYDAGIHRAKTMTKVTSFMQSGNAWGNCCKSPKSIERVVSDFLGRTYYG